MSKDAAAQEKDEETSMSADLEAAWDELEVVDKDEEGSKDEDEKDDESEDENKDASDDDNEESGKDKDDGDEDPDDPGSDDVEKDDEDEEEDDDEADEASAAPDSWTPEAREEWKDIPEAAQQTILAREQEVKQVLYDGAESRRVSETFQQTIAPYNATMQSLGYTNAYEAVGAALGALNTLAIGTPTAKAQTLVDLIAQFGVSVQDMDDMMSGEDTGAGAAVDTAVAAALKPLQDRLAKFEEADPGGASNTAVQDEITTWSKGKEFFKDLGPAMGHLMQAAASAGQSMSLDKAYEQAGKMHPGISKIMERRSNKGKRNSNKKKKNASSSVSGKQSSDKSQNKEDGSIRGSLIKAMDDLQDE